MCPVSIVAAERDGPNRLPQNLVATNSTALDVAELIKLCLKTFWSATWMEAPPILLQPEQFGGWMMVLHTLLVRPVPEVRKVRVYRKSLAQAGSLGRPCQRRALLIKPPQAMFHNSSLVSYHAGGWAGGLGKHATRSCRFITCTTLPEHVSGTAGIFTLCACTALLSGSSGFSSLSSSTAWLCI